VEEAGDESGVRRKGVVSKSRANSRAKKRAS